MTEEAHVADQIQIRRDTASNWSSNNPTLAAGEQGWESDTNKMKVGDGSAAWNSLSYFHSQGYQSSDAQLTDIAGLTPTDGNFIVGDGSNFVTESGVTVRASLGLTIGTDVQAYDAQLADIAGLNPTDGNFIVGDGSNFVLESGATARTSLGLGTIATAATSDYAATANNLSDLASASTARTNLGVAIGTDVQAYDAQLADIAGLNPTDGYIIVGDGSNFVTENGATARTSLGLTIGTDVLAHDANLSSFVSTFTLPTSDGSNGQAIITDGSGTLSFSTISGGGGSGLQQDFTANGAITSGKAVILETAGTVAQVGESTTARNYPETSSTQTSYGTGNYVMSASYARGVSSLYIAEHSGSTKKMIHMFNDGDSSGYSKGANIRVIAYDGTNYTLGTRINISGDTTNYNQFYNSSIVSTSTSGTFLIFYTHLDSDGSGGGTAYTKYRTLTYSGTTITLGSEVDFDVDVTGQSVFKVVEDPHQSDRYVVAYRDSNNSNYYTIKVLTNSNGTISYGTKITLISSTAYNFYQFRLDPKVEGRYLLIEGSNQTHIRTGVINYTANTATCGSSVTPGSGASQLGADWDPFNSGKVVVSYDTDWTLGQRKVQARVGTYSSGTNAVSFSASQVAFPTNGGDNGSSNIPCEVIAQPGAANQFWSVKQHESSGSDYFYVCAIEVSDTTPSITEYTSSKRHGVYAIDCKDKQIAVAEFGDPGVILKYGYSKYTASNIAEGSFIGFASETVSDAGTVTVDLTGGTTTSQSSLTIGSTYYVQDDGSVGTTVSSTAEVFAGKATAADTLLIGVHDSSIVKDSDIGSAVQAYNANYLTSSAIGSSVQAYDSNLTSFVSALTLPTSDGSADQVLKTDGSGTLSFTTLSSGGGTPTATLTVAGGVSAGDIIVYNSSGSQYEAAGNVTISASVTPSAVGFNGSGFRSTSINQINGPTGNGLYHTGYDKGFIITYESSARKYRWVTMNSDYSVSFSSAASLPSDSIFPKFLFQPANDKIALIWSDGTNMIANVGDINLSTGAISWEGSNQTLSSSDTWNTAASNGGSQLVYDSNDDKWIVLYRDASNNGMLRAISYNSSTLALTAGTAVEIEDGYLYSGGLDFDPNRSAGLVCYADTSSPYVNYRKWSCSSGTITVGTQTSISNSGYGSYSPKYPTYPAMCHYNSVTGKFVFLYGYSFNDGYNQRSWPTGYHTAVINENGTVSLSDSGVNTSFGGNSRSDGNSGWSVFDSASGTVNHAVYGNYSQSYYMSMQTFKQASDGAITAGGTQLYYYSNAGSSITALTYSADQKYTLLCFTGASSNVSKSYSWQNTLTTTNITNQVIGVATEAISNGATGSINIIGGVDDNQSGLTANQTYYLVADGTLSTTADDNNVKFGYSLSTTEIMMKGFS